MTKRLDPHGVASAQPRLAAPAGMAGVMTSAVILSLRALALAHPSDRSSAGVEGGAGPSASEGPPLGQCRSPCSADEPRSDSLDGGVASGAIVALANDRGLVCSGTLIAPRHVLTARHCLPLREARFGPEPSAPNESIRITAFHVPPLAAVDAAVVELSRPSSVRPLRVRAATDRTPPHGFVRLAGFGATDTAGARGMSRLHFVDVFVRDWGCDRTTEARTGCIEGFEIVVPRDGGNDTCAGDSGGPLLERSSDGLRVVGVTSRAVQGALLRCGDGGIYTRTDAIGQWLNNLKLGIGEEIR